MLSRPDGLRSHPQLDANNKLNNVVGRWIVAPVYLVNYIIKQEITGHKNQTYTHVLHAKLARYTSISMTIPSQWERGLLVTKLQI